MKKIIDIAYERDVPRKKLSGQMMWFGLWFVLTAIGLFLLKANPDGHGTHTQLGLPPCPSVVFFDRPCPGCGMTTSWTSAIHGEVGRAFMVHPFGPILYYGFTLTALMGLYGFVRKMRLRSEHPGFNKFMVVVLVGFLAFGGIRFVMGPMNSKYSFSYWQNKQASQSKEGGSTASVPEDGTAGEVAPSSQVQ